MTDYLEGKICPYVDRRCTRECAAFVPAVEQETSGGKIIKHGDLCLRLAHDETVEQPFESFTPTEVVG